MPMRGDRLFPHQHPNNHHSKNLSAWLGAASMEELIWEQYTVTLQKANKKGFGIAVSGGKDNPHFENGEPSIVISDVLPGGPAERLLQENDRVVMVNGIPMDNVLHSFAVQQLKKCGKTAVIVVKRPRKVQVTASPEPDPRYFDPIEDDRRSAHSGYSGSWHSGNGHRSRDSSPDKSYIREQERGRSFEKDQERVRGRSRERELDDEHEYRREHSQGRGIERDLTEEHRYKRDRGRSVDREESFDRSYSGDYSPDRGIGRRVPTDYKNDKEMQQSRDRLQSHSPSPEPDRLYAQPVHKGQRKPVGVLLCKNRPNEGNGGKEEDVTVNLSQHVLTDNERRVLMKGLSFVPTTIPDDFATYIDTMRFQRQLKLGDFFQGKVMEDNRHPFKKPSTFEPPTTNPSIKTFTRLVQQRVRQGEHGPTRNNMTTSDWEAVQSLRNDSTIVIRPADKGGAVVLQDYQEYKAEIDRQLADNSTYRALSCDPTISYKTQIDSVIEHAARMNWIDSTTKEWLTTDYPVRPILYTLPKIHKQLINPPGRPIVLARGSLLQPLAKFVDALLQPLVVNMRSYLRDSSALITYLTKLTDIQPGDVLASLDVTSLYTIIPHEMGMEIITNCLDRCPFVGPPTSFIVELLSLCLKLNYFKEKCSNSNLTNVTLSYIKCLGSVLISYIHAMHAYIHTYIHACVIYNCSVEFTTIFLQADGNDDDDDDRMSYLTAMGADYLSCDSRLVSDFEDTDGEGGAYTDNELDETVDDPLPVSAISRSSEPVLPEEPVIKPIPEVKAQMRRAGSREVLRDPSPPPSFKPEPPKVKPQGKDDLYDSPRSYEAKRNSSSVASGETSGGSSKAIPPPTAAKPVLVGKPILKPSLPVNPSPAKSEEQNPVDENAPKSVLGKVKIFEKMDYSARAQRIQELHEAQNARLELAQKLPDIYAVPIKPQKNDQNRPQQTSSRPPEPQKPPSWSYLDKKASYGSDDEEEEEYRRQLADQSKRGFYAPPTKYRDTEL
ncbi:tight junction protein ZO-2 [Bombina bombina]|uniref:tight junction protein ZO-2 n=1 Tax=Bombina bombina TaxID=8345 RepID=UPI00235A8950|nr:tight junction protein ZO-2 [Bombina bombina]